MNYSTDSRFFSVSPETAEPFLAQLSPASALEQAYAQAPSTLATPQLRMQKPLVLQPTTTAWP
jgi:hypothetical protein